MYTLERMGASMTGTYLRFYFREWRKFRAYTQEEVAEKLKVKRQTVSRIESGKATFDIMFLINFANLVQCPHFTDPIVRPPDTMGFKGHSPFSLEPERVRELREELESEEDS